MTSQTDMDELLSYDFTFLDLASLLSRRRFRSTDIPLGKLNCRRLEVTVALSRLLRENGFTMPAFYLSSHHQRLRNVTPLALLARASTFNELEKTDRILTHMIKRGHQPLIEVELPLLDT